MIVRSFWTAALATVVLVIGPAGAEPVPDEGARSEAALAEIRHIPGEEPLAEPEAAPGDLEPVPAEPARLAGEGAERIGRAWLQPANTLDDRVALTRRTSLELGVWDLDAAARALMALDTDDDPLGHARAAVRLSPNLPTARMALARALWLHAEAPAEAIRTAFGSLWVIPRHVEASLWFGGSLLFVLGVACVVGGLWCIALIGGFAARHATHDLGDLLSASAPDFARLALLGSALLVPLAFGEGLLGVGLVLLAVGVFYGDLRQRLTLVLAASVVVLGAYPVMRLAGNALTAISTDPVAAAALSTDQGFTYPVDQVRIESAADYDVLAAQALALRARREGNLGQADARYQQLLTRSPRDPVLANNAANVRLNLGHMESALALYQESVELKPHPVVLFNLSQAHGRAFQVEDLSRTLSEAQRLNGDVVAELTALQGAEPIGFVVDLPIEPRQIWQRILRSDAGEGIAAELRATIAPGRLGRDGLVAQGAFVAVALLFGVAGNWVRRSSVCSRCGRRMCPRCHPEMGRGAVCAGCTRLFHQSETTDREARLARIQELRTREARIERFAVAAAFAVPGAAGVVAGRPLRALIGSLLGAVTLLAILCRDGVVPDPLVAGASAPFAFLCVAAVATLIHALIALVCLATRRNS